MLKTGGAVLLGPRTILALFCSAVVLAICFQQQGGGSDHPIAPGPLDEYEGGRGEANLEEFDNERVRVQEADDGHASSIDEPQDRKGSWGFQVLVVDVDGALVALPTIECQDAMIHWEGVVANVNVHGEGMMERVKVTVNAPGFVKRIVEIERGVGLDGKVTKVSLVRGATLQGAVYAPGGLPLSGVVIEQRVSQGGLGGVPQRQVLAETGKDGSFEIDSVELKVLHLWFSHEMYPDLLLRVDASLGDVLGLRVQLLKGGSISGVVMGLGDLDCSQVRVTALFDGPLGMPRPADAQQSVKCSDTGAFTLTGLAPNDQGAPYSLRAWWGSGPGRMQIGGPVAARTGATELEMSVGVVPLMLEVQDAETGEEIASDTIRVYEADGAKRTRYPVLSVDKGDKTALAVIGVQGSLQIMAEVEKSGYYGKRIKISWSLDGVSLVGGVVSLDPMKVLDIMVTNGLDGTPVSGAEICALNGRVDTDEITRQMASIQAASEVGSYLKGARQRVFSDDRGRAVIYLPSDEACHLAANHPEVGWFGPLSIEHRVDEPLKIELEMGGQVEVEGLDQWTEAVPERRGKSVVWKLSVRVHVKEGVGWLEVGGGVEVFDKDCARTVSDGKCYTVRDRDGGVSCENVKCKGQCFPYRIFGAVDLGKGKRGDICGCECYDDGGGDGEGNRCGPDIADWLIREAFLLNQEVARRGGGGNAGIRKRGDVVQDIGGNLRYGKDDARKSGPTRFTTSAGDANNCPAGKDCIDTATLCGECLHRTEVGNFLFGAVVGFAGLPLGTAILGPTLHNILPGDDVDTPNSLQDRVSIAAGYDFSRTVKNPGRTFASIRTELCSAIKSAGGSNISAPAVKKCLPCGSKIPSGSPHGFNDKNGEWTVPGLVTT